MVVDLGISLQGQRFYLGVAVFDRDEADGEIEYGGRLSGVPRAGAVAQGGEVPSAILGEDQMDLGGIDLKTLHNQLVVEDEWLHLNANAQSFSGDEWSLAEL